MKSPKHIFISFKTEEVDVAFKMRESLKGIYKIWWQQDLQCGHEWNVDIDKALNEAGAVIVLWSNKSYASPWVRHEASYAMAKNVYCPVKIEAVAIDSPFALFQSTDVTNWEGETNHQGFQNLLMRLDELMPSKSKAVRNYLHRNTRTIVSSAIAFLSLSILFVLWKSMETQLLTQASLVDSLKVQSEVQRKQFQKMNELSDSQNVVLQSMNIQGNLIENQVELQSEISENVNKTVSSLKNILYPLDSLDLQVAFNDAISIEELKFLDCNIYLFDKDLFRTRYKFPHTTDTAELTKLIETAINENLYNFNSLKRYEPKNGIQTIYFEPPVGKKFTYLIKNIFRGHFKNTGRYKGIYDLSNVVLLLDFHFRNGKSHPIVQTRLLFGNISQELNSKISIQNGEWQTLFAIIGPDYIDELLRVK